MGQALMLMTLSLVDRTKPSHYSEASGTKGGEGIKVEACTQGPLESRDLRRPGQLDFVDGASTKNSARGAEVMDHRLEQADLLLQR